MKSMQGESIAPRGRRRGAAILELILALPLLVFATVGGLQFGLMMLVHHTIRAAANEGARAAAGGAGVDEVRDVVNSVLAVHGVSVGPGVRVMVDGELVGSRGDGSLSPNLPMMALVSREVRVAVIADFSATPLPNALLTCGIDFSTKQFEASAIDRMPCS